MRKRVGAPPLTAVEPRLSQDERRSESAMVVICGWGAKTRATARKTSIQAFLVTAAHRGSFFNGRPS